MRKYVIIVAGGKGVRMGENTPKQFLPIGKNKPVLIYTIEAFYKYDPQIKIILVLPKEQRKYWEKLCDLLNFTIKHSIVDGGATRYHSVKNGLSVVTDNNSVVGIHDGVRPFVSESVIAGCYTVAQSHKAVIPVIDIVETIREITGDGTRTVNRDNYKIVQTPQVFDTKLLKRAYSQDYDPLFTDDASVVEGLGETIFMVAGNRENIKITTQYDLKIAGALLQCST